MEGWIKLHRRFLKWEWWDYPNMVKVFLYLLLSANFETKKWMGITIERGQLVTGRKKLASELKVSERNIRTCLSNLEKTGELTIKTTNKYSIITICNYDTYQDINNINDQQSDQPSTSNRPATDQQPTTTKEVKKEKKDKNVKKIKYAEFVFLTEEEYKKLVDKHSVYWTKKMIEALDNYKGAKGKTYKSDYRAILSWVEEKIKTSKDYSSWKTKKIKEEKRIKAKEEAKIMDELRKHNPEIDLINKTNEEIL
jgi:hypothetical protein